MSSRPCPDPVLRAKGSSCDVCGEFMPDGPDACLGWIPGVSQACCGHGVVDSAFVYLGPSDGRCVILKARDALAFFDLVRGGKLVTPG